jgi:hypothetical protein
VRERVGEIVNRNPNQTQREYVRGRDPFWPVE